jgi:hypothetical protein
VIVDHSDQLVDKESLRRRAFGAGRRLFRQPPRDFCPPIGKRLTQQADDLLATALGTGFGNDIGNRCGKAAPLDDGALVG